MNNFLLISLFLMLSCNQPEEVESTPEEIALKMMAIHEEIEDTLITSCQEDTQCCAIPFGVKACGGPLRYLIYSDATNQSLLQQLVNNYNDLNIMYNNLVNPISDCGLVSKPEVGCVSGNCVAID